MLTHFHASLSLSPSPGTLVYSIEARIAGKTFERHHTFNFSQLVNKSLLDHLFEQTRRQFMVEINDYVANLQKDN